MDVFGDPEELVFLLDHNCFIYSLEEMANAFVFFIEIHRISGG